VLTVGSLFSGIGGIDLGLQMTGGFETRWFCEIDPYCQRVLAKHWPDVPCYGDIRELRGSDVEPVDVLVGGFPCQPVSIAGRRLGESDPRWLWPHFARFICTVQPRWALLENTTGLLSSGMGSVLRDLAQSGYDAEWRVLSAAELGAPHLRDRVWIVAYPSEPRLPFWGGSSLAGSREPQPKSQRRGSVFDELQDDTGLATDQGWWAVEPAVGRVAHGIPNRVDRLRGLGNAVVPQVVEHIGRRILEVAY
jgi:DNA (cytosine-5)-methyltransferase 1